MEITKNHHLHAVISVLCALFCLGPVFVSDVTGKSHQRNQVEHNPVEVGDVAWMRDYDEALALSRHTGKPILLLFQEVPGCLGCRTFGQRVLSDSLIVRAIETAFIPVLVFNNRSSGPDAELLARFNEPSWNYQVIRFLDSNENDIIPRKDKIWDRAGVAKRMVRALETVHRPVPPYLREIAEISGADNSDTAHDNENPPSSGPKP